MRRLLSLVVLVLLAAPSARATTTTFGSGLGAAPDTTLGCETAPFIANPNGDFGFQASNQPDCTWRQTGVFGSASDPRFSSVPGDGRITKVEVRSGPNPAPLRFVVIRQLGNAGATQDTQCCFFVSETAPVTPAPNAVSTFVVSIPVQRNTLDGVRAFDLMAVSAVSGTGTLPLLQTGPQNTFATTQSGAVDAGFFYPRMGAEPNDTGGGRREQGISGVELTVRWTWASADDPSLAAPQPAPQAPQPGPVVPAAAAAPVAPSLARTSARLRDGRAQIALACKGNAACAGQLELLARSAGTRAAATKKAVSYGRASYAVKAGGKATIKLKLGTKGKRAVRGRQRLEAVLVLTPKGGKAVRRQLTLRR